MTNSRFHNNNYGIATNDVLTLEPYNITLTGNEFGTLAGGLRAAYAGQSPVPLSKGFAGIYASQMIYGNNSLIPLSILADPSTGNTNRFFNLRYGIISYSSLMTVKNAEFTDITVVPGGNGYVGPSMNGRAMYGRNSTLTVNGADFDDPQVKFYNCGVGVETENCTLTASFTKMDQMGTGISVLSATNRSTTIIFNTIRAESYGIKANNVTSLPVSVGFNVINNVYIQDPKKASVGIQVANSSANNQSLQVYSNRVALFEGGAGIELRHNTNLWAYNNDVDLTNASPLKNFGLRLEGGNNNLLSCNRTDGGLLGSSSGLYALHADRSAFTCNHVEKGVYGLRFEGVLTGEADANIVTNTMTNNTIGLYYGEGAITGPQSHRGNKWVGTGAQHINSFNIAQQSKYTIDVTENSTFLPASVSPPGWFDDLDNPNVSPSCPTNSDCNALRPNPKADMDRKIAKGQLLADPYSAATNWLAQRRLHARLTTEGNPYPDDPDFKDFLQTAEDTGLDRYANLQASLAQLFTIGQADIESLRDWENETQQRLEQIEELDELLAKKGVSKQDSLEYAERRTIEAEELATLETNRQSKLAALQSTRLAAIPDLLSQNNALTGTVHYQQYEKAVNGIFLQTVASDVYTFTAAQQTLLDSIARQCPLSRGEAVLRARALLTIVQQAPINYDNETACLPANREGRHVARTGELRMYPNPALNMLTVDYPGAEPAELRFFNAFGQQVIRVQLSDQEVRQLDLSALQSGIYWYVLQTDTQPTIIGKLLISR